MQSVKFLSQWENVLIWLQESSIHCY